jgi:hypothetical protein
MDGKARVPLEQRMTLYMQLRRHYSPRVYRDPRLYVLPIQIVLRSALRLLGGLVALLLVSCAGLVLIGGLAGLELGGAALAPASAAAWRAALPVAALLLTLWVMVAPGPDAGFCWVFARHADEQADRAAHVRGLL